MDIIHLLKSQQLEFTNVEAQYICQAIQNKIYRNLQPGELVSPVDFILGSFLKTAGEKLAQKVHFNPNRKASGFKISLLPKEILALYMAIGYTQETMGAYIKIEKAALHYSYLIDFSSINHSSTCKTSHSTQPKTMLTSPSKRES